MFKLLGRIKHVCMNFSSSVYHANIKFYNDILMNDSNSLYITADEKRPDNFLYFPFEEKAH